MKLHRIDGGWDTAIVCARCAVRLAAQPHAARADKADETLYLEADDKIIVDSEGRLPSMVSCATVPGRRQRAFVRDIEWSPGVFQNGIDGIPDDLFETVSDEDDHGRPLIHRAFTAFRDECNGFVADGLTPPARSPARMSTYICNKYAYEYVSSKYAHESHARQRQRTVPLKRALKRLLREYRIVF